MFEEKSERDRERRALLARGVRLEYATLAWNVVGSLVVFAAALQARSGALAGFAVDSIIEIFASLVVVRELRSALDGSERRALRTIGAAFFALAAYLAIQSAYVFATHARPAPSPGGIAWLGLTAIVMVLLASGKSAVGKRLGNAVLTTEARVTMVDALLAGSVLLGLACNARFGWWWADPAAALVIVFYGLREGVHATRASASGSPNDGSDSGP